MGFLESRLGLDDAQAQACADAALGARMQRGDNLKPTFDFLESRLGLDDAQVRKLVLKLPSVLGYSVEDNLEPTIEFYANTLAVDTPRLAEFILSLPSLLGYSLPKRLQPRHRRMVEAGVT